MIKKINTNTQWENIVGYSRAIRHGVMIEIAGTTAVDEEGNVVGKNDPYEQTRFIIKKAKKALIELGSNLDDVIRTRIYVTDISHWEKIGTAHGEFFHSIKPVSTMVEVQRLVQPELMVEIEFSAMTS